MSPETLHTPPPRRLRLAGIIAAIVVLAIVVAGVATRANDSHKLREWTDEQAVPTVNVVNPQGGQGGGDLNLPGRLQAYSRAPIYARTSGYLKYWKADIGQKVKAGEVLAEIETPDLDQQLLQAKADLASARANEALAQTTAKRWKSMRDSDSVSKQEVDEKTGDYDAKHALATAAQANLERIQALKGFAKLTAPFDGTVTARETDVGALINAGGGGQELFVVSDVRKLRMYVNVPQNYAPSVKQGSTVKLAVPEYPGQTFTGTVESSSSAISAATGT
ncbi:MAG: efflux RND transporter periplasmic adaptor subunit, partial [Luteibacter sp.]